jgi:hypothetical protein
MENMANDLNMVEELDEYQEDEKSSSTKSLNHSRETVASGGGAEITDLIFKTSPLPSSLPSSTAAKNRMSSTLTSILHNKASDSAAGDGGGRFAKVILSPLERRQQPSSGSNMMNVINENVAAERFECDRASLNSVDINSGGGGGANGNKQINISTTAFNTFTKIIPILGPVLTCKYCCVDLLKMLAICYMNSKCLSPIENGGMLL